jgi:hypothetical protein
VRARIRVNDLSQVQWDYLRENLPVSYNIPDNVIRVCVEFEFQFGPDVRHVEMPARTFVTWMTRLRRVQHEAEATLTLSANADGKPVRGPEIIGRDSNDLPIYEPYRSVDA